MPAAAAVRVKVRAKVTVAVRPVLPARCRLCHSCDGRPGIVRERVRATFWRLYVFSCEHPQYFALIFID